MLAAANMLKSRLPRALSAFLMTLCTVDDIGAMAVIAFVFAKELSVAFLLGAGVAVLSLDVLRRRKVRAPELYLLAGIALWYCLLRGGIAADIAGVLTGFAIPAVPAPWHTKAPEKWPTLLDHFIRFWTNWVGLIIMPLFVMANMAMPLSVSPMAVASSPVAQGIIAGLVLGKPLGIAGGSLLALKLKWCQLPTGMRPIHLCIGGLLGGVAFTMSLFMIEESLSGPIVRVAKVAVVIASAIALALASGITATLPLETIYKGGPTGPTLVDPAQLEPEEVLKNSVSDQEKMDLNLTAAERNDANSSVQAFPDGNALAEIAESQTGSFTKGIMDITRTERVAIFAVSTFAFAMLSRGRGAVVVGEAPLLAN
eukprot:gnl/TRDRNA2_/TRDRNA2_46127_c1_seq1.p1 gnl/TRDRNA2_/TRDRNA2_46127_c1~~gnl/TRDRNA2_/TRDRNA2_46127_c1_seq1.p1  ORF type:complete len:423 (-),score=51.77 gnl/TRDRNA2_/TRDRNA2_46127_c1_seq1:202-1308(-)